ncbi:hypothetical protein ANN_24745 [Periplaneta americana]|uniref:Uncharacterized protein n=1 Tax=Periplaneta americana TaxID=6978 RepID=A0ABQ8RZR3_PERAM|nr:hypothetical protein ANN_24745 [Periplaneta americana]
MPLSSHEVAAAVTLVENVHSLGHIARTFNAAPCILDRALRRFWETQQYTRRPGSGRKRKTSARDDHRFLVHQILQDRHTTTVEARNRLQLATHNIS